MTNVNNEIIEIEPVVSGVPTVKLGSGILPILEALNPLGVIGEAITQILAYSTESKRLDLERERIRAQAKAIDSALQLRLAYEMRQFDLQREALLACLTHAETVLHERRATRQALIRSLDNLNIAMTKLFIQQDINPTISSLYRDSLSIVVEQLVKLEEAGSSEVMAMSDQLHRIVGDVRRELEGTQPAKLLPPARKG